MILVQAGHTAGECGFDQRPHDLGLLVLLFARDHVHGAQLALSGFCQGLVGSHAVRDGLEEPGP